MRNKIKEYLCRKRFKVKMLKNNKGFSLLEVLVAVSIIGIITAIAIPQFTANRNQAAKIASTTTIVNIRKAYDACRVLKTHGDCDSLGEIGIVCDDCTSYSNGSKFCAHIVRGATQGEPSGDFAACISIEGTSSTRTFGGTLMDKAKICHSKQCKTGQINASGACVDWEDFSATSTLKNCNAPADCGSQITEPSSGVTAQTTVYTCKEPDTQKGLCNSSSALCE